MDWKVIALIISVFLNVILGIRQFVGLLSDLRELAIRLVVWLSGMPMVIKQWGWWRKYRPSWRIASWGTVKVKYAEGKYHMEFQLYLEFKSNNDRYDTHLFCDRTLLDMYHSGKGWEKRPYRMSCKLVVPELATLKLEPRDSALVEYVCTINISERPLVKDTVTCKVVEEWLGGAAILTPHIRLDGSVKREGANHFEAKVLWESRDDIYDKENQA